MGRGGERRGGGGAAETGTAGGEKPQPVFISWREQKVTQHSSKPAKKSGAGHAYVVRFYLIDSSGGEHLAAEGEDQGDAHYLYANQADFPFLYCHNKQDVISWLEGILQSSKLRAGFRTEQVLDRAPSDPAAVRLPPFVAYRHEKFEMVDGRHAMKWFLIDQQAQEHLAVTGEEKETRDGHYAYRTAGVFDVVKPLECGNQAEVVRWLDSMVVAHHKEGPSGHLAGKATPAHTRDSAGGGRPTGSGGTIRSDTTGGGSRGGSTRGRGRGGKKGSKRGGDDLLRHATTNLKRKAHAGRGGGHVAAGDSAALGGAAERRGAVVGELRRWTQEEAMKREATKKAALAFLSDDLKDEERHALQLALGVLGRAASNPALLPPDSKSATHHQVLLLVDVLGALRQVAHMYLPLKQLATSGLPQMLGTLQKHKNREVSELSSGTLEQWLRTLAAHTAVLADPRYVTDPRKELAGRLEDAQEVERLVAEITHQAPSMHSRPALGSARAGWSTPSAGGVGDGTQETAGEGAGSPTGIPYTPSDASLPTLERDDGAGAPTLERRRLDLDLSTATAGLEGAAAAPGPAPLPSTAPTQPPVPPLQAAGGARPASPFADPAQQAQQREQGSGEGGHEGQMAALPSQALLDNPMHMELDAQLL